MLTIIINGYNKAGQVIHWHIGEQSPNLDPKVIIDMSMDCDELDYILERFPEFKMFRNTKKNVLYLCGDLAKTLYMNIFFGGEKQ